MNINLTLIGQTITFFVFVWFVRKFVWTAIITAMEARSEKIANGLEAAERAERDLELAKEEAGKKLREAKAAGFVDAVGGMLGAPGRSGWIERGLPTVTREAALAALPSELA